MTERQLDISLEEEHETVSELGAKFDRVVEVPSTSEDIIETNNTATASEVISGVLTKEVSQDRVNTVHESGARTEVNNEAVIENMVIDSEVSVEEDKVKEFIERTGVISEGITEAVTETKSENIIIDSEFSVEEEDKAKVAYEIHPVEEFNERTEVISEGITEAVVETKNENTVDSEVSVEEEDKVEIVHEVHPVQEFNKGTEVISGGITEVIAKTEVNSETVVETKNENIVIDSEVSAEKEDKFNERTEVINEGITEAVIETKNENIVIDSEEDKVKVVHEIHPVQEFNEGTEVISGGITEVIVKTEVNSETVVETKNENTVIDSEASVEKEDKVKIVHEVHPVEEFNERTKVISEGIAEDTVISSEASIEQEDLDKVQTVHETHPLQELNAKIEVASETENETTGTDTRDTSIGESNEEVDTKHEAGAVQEHGVNLDKLIVETELAIENEDDIPTAASFHIKENTGADKDVSVEVVYLEKETTSENGKVGETTLNTGLVSMPAKKTTTEIEDVAKAFLEDNSTNTEDIPTHEKTVQTVTTVSETDEVVVKELTKKDVEVDAEITTNTTFNKKNTIETPDPTTTFNETATEKIDVVEESSALDQGIEDDTEIAIEHKNATVKQEEAYNIAPGTPPLTIERDLWNGEIPERPPQASPIAPRTKKTEILTSARDDAGSEDSNNVEDSDFAEDSITVEKGKLNNEANEIRQRISYSDIYEGDQIIIGAAKDFDEEDSPPQRVQTLLEQTSPSSMMADVLESMFNPGFNNNVILFITIIFVLLFICLIFLAVITDYNIYVLVFLGLSVALFISLQWFVANVASAQTVEAMEAEAVQKKVD